MNCFSGTDGGCRRRGPKPREVRLDLLSAEERAYLLGLYFADGCVMEVRRRLGGVVFYLSEGEEELAERVAGVFRRLGLNPVVEPATGSRMVSVSVCSVLLFPNLFPDKRQFSGLRLGDGLVARWLLDEELLGGSGGKVSKLGVPFIAGLLDGDGTVEASLCFDRSVFGYVEKEWYFSQRKYPFLVDYLMGYLDDVLGAGKGTFSSHVEDTGVRSVGFLSCGQAVLLSLGLARWSWKVEKWMEEVERLEKEHVDLMARFWTTHEVARRLQADPKSVFDWCRKGRVRHMCIRSVGARHYTRLIPADEVERLVKMVRERKAEERRAMSGRREGRLLTVREVSYALNVSPCLVRLLWREGRLRAVCLLSLCGSNKKRYLIPVEEVERLKRELDKER